MKGLEALEKLWQGATNPHAYLLDDEPSNIALKETIDKELKDYENLKLKHRSMQDAVLEDFKKLKALEIIKKKRVDIHKLLLLIEIPINDDLQLENYNNSVTNTNSYLPNCSRYLTQEEYDLLKEVLV